MHVPFDSRTVARWKNWHHPRYAIALGWAACCWYLAQQDEDKRSPVDPLWRVDNFCYGHLRRLMLAIYEYCHGGVQQNVVMTRWSRINKGYRQRPFMQPIINLVAVIEARTVYHPQAHERCPVYGAADDDEHRLGRSLDERSAISWWQGDHLNQIVRDVPAEAFAEMEMPWRIQDFSDGRGSSVPRRVALAAMAVYDMDPEDGWLHATILVRRWLDENEVTRDAR